MVNSYPLDKEYWLSFYLVLEVHFNTVQTLLHQMKIMWSVQKIAIVIHNNLLWSAEPCGHVILMSASGDTDIEFMSWEIFRSV